MPDPIRIDGLAEFSRKLRKLDADLPKALRLALNDAADLVVGYAQPRVPRRTGRAAATIKGRSTRTLARVTGGSNRAPYYPWLDFGGNVGRKDSVKRAWIKEGRYIFRGYFAKREDIGERLQRNLIGVAIAAGISVETGGG